MHRDVMLKALIADYSRFSASHNYIVGFVYKKVVYAVKATPEILPYILTIDKASRGGGYSLRFCPTNEQKILLLGMGAKVICSEEFFNELVKASKYNKGEIFEKLITERFGQVWKKDNVKWWMDGDITINGTKYQIKFQKATFTNEKQLEGLR